MPDPDGTTAVAETPVETPEEPQPLPTPEPSAEPPAGQEPESVPAKETEPESVAPQSEDNAEPVSATQEAIDAIGELAKNNPEAAAQLREKLGIDEKPEESVETERWDWDLEKSQTERNTLWQNAQNQYNQYGKEAVEKQLTAYFSTLNDNVRDAAAKANSGDIEYTAVGFDAAQVVKALTPYFEGGQNAAHGLAQAASHYTGFDSLEKHASHRLLNADERKQFSEARKANNLAAAQELQLVAAGRGPSAAALAAQAKEEAAQDTKVLEAAAKVTQALSKNGANAGDGGPPKKTGPTTLEEVNAAMENLDTPVKELPALTKQRDKLLGR